MNHSVPSKPANTANKLHCSAPYFLAFGIFICIISPVFLAEGMFMDGLYYASISRNLASGAGSFWNPHFTNTVFPEFHEHPPLVFGLQSLFFRLFGDSIYVERFYSLLTVVLTSGFIVLIWRELSGSLKYSWITLLLWFSIPLTGWACCNNMLENTMAVFSSAAIYFVLLSTKRKHYFFLTLACIFLFAALLSKGPYALFIFSFPALYCLFDRKTKIRRAIIDTLLLFTFTSAFFLILFLFFPQAYSSLHEYWNNQLVQSFREEITVESRFFILGKLLRELGVPLVLSAIILIAGSKIFSEIFRSGRGRIFFFLLCFSFSGVLPIMISLKQSGYYMIPVFPFFGMALAYLIVPLIERFSNWLKQRKILQTSLTLFCLGVFMGGSAYCISMFGTIGRDIEKVTDAKLILQEIPQGSTIGLCPELALDWALHGYFQRYGKVSLDPDTTRYHDYFLISSKECSGKPTNMKVVNLDTREFLLYTRK